MINTKQRSPGLTWCCIGWNIFLIHGIYGVYAELIGPLDAAIPAQKRDADGAHTLAIHLDLVIGHLAYVGEHERVERDLRRQLSRQPPQAQASSAEART